MVVARGWGEGAGAGEMRSWCLIDTVSVLQDEKNSGDGLVVMVVQ